MTTGTHSVPTIGQLTDELARVKAEAADAIRGRDRKITELREQARKATEVERERCAAILRAAIESIDTMREEAKRQGWPTTASTAARCRTEAQEALAKIEVGK